MNIYLVMLTLQVPGQATWSEQRVVEAANATRSSLFKRAMSWVPPYLAGANVTFFYAEPNEFGAEHTKAVRVQGGAQS